MKKILQSSNWGSIGSWSMALRRELKETALSAPGAANGRTSQGFTNSIEILPNSSQQLCSCYKRRKSLKILNGVFFETIIKLNYFCILCKDIWLFSFIILIKHQSAFPLIDFCESIPAFPLFQLHTIFADHRWHPDPKIFLNIPFSRMV